MMQPFLALLGRCAMGTIFLVSGFHKIVAHSATVGSMTKAHIPHPGLLYYATVIVEFGGGLMLVLGARARVAAMVLAAFLVPVTYYFHFHFSDQAQMANFLKNLAIFGGLLVVAAFGPGRWSLDRN